MMTTSKMMMSCVLFFALAVGVAGEKDSDYYFPGFTNPLVDSSQMYWKDSINVLQDLDKFEALYVKYHHCV